MGRKGPDPQAAAREAADRAYNEQQKLIADIQNRAGQYESKAKSQIDTLSNLTGKSMQDYIGETRGAFDKYMSGITAQYKPQFESYTPGILASDSTTQLENKLRQYTGEFQQGVGDVSREGSARLYATLAAPGKQFSELGANPAFNLQLDPRAMGLASKPPTIRSDVQSMKPLYTYNV